MDDSDELAGLRVELVVPLSHGLLEALHSHLVVPLSPELIEVCRGVRWAVASPTGNSPLTPAQPADPVYTAYAEEVRALRARQPAASEAEFQEWLPAVLELFPDAVEVTPQFLIEWDLRREPPEDWVNDAIDRRAQLYSPAERAFLLVQGGGSIRRLTADRFSGTQRPFT